MALAPEEVGERIRQARLAQGWTHEQLANEMRVGLRTVQRWQKGRNPKDGKSWLPRLGTLMELADVLDVPRSFFVEDELGAGPLADLARELAQVRETGEASRAMLAELLRRIEDPPRESEGGEA